MKYKLPIILFCFLLICCNNPAKISDIKDSTLNKDSIKVIDSLTPFEKIAATIPKDIQPIIGYRFFIEGDFDGDGKKEKLTEHYTSSADGKETNKRYSLIGDNAQLIALQDKKEPYSYLLSNNNKIDTFRLGERGNGQLLGLSLLRNEGDLNGDGRDEVSYIRQYADWSSLNSLHIITYAKQGWKELYATICYDSDAPELYDIDLPKESWNKPIYVNVNLLTNYKSRVTKIKRGVIAVQAYGEGMAYETVDTVKLPLKIK